MRTAVLELEASQIREVANAGMGRDDVLAFWFGESDEVTPEVIREAAVASIRQGETFYAHNLGLPALREAIANYTSALHPAVGPDRVAVTSGGVSGLMIAVQALVDAGDGVVAVTPVWPNLVAQPKVMGARVRTVALTPVAGRWQLDLDRLLSAITPATRLLIINAPNNPTGWTLNATEQAAILARCRHTGTWILADEVYERLCYEGQTAQGCAPSFLDLAAPEDRLVVAQSFSKSFLMTGWRLGWLVAPADVVPDLGKLIEFNTSCISVFTQRAGLAALAHSHRITPGVVAHLQASRDVLLEQLQTLPGIEVAPAPGGMYAFFKLQGFENSLTLAKRLVVEAGLGLAPGSAFAPEAQGWLRWCFATQDTARLVQGVDRLRNWLKL